MASSGAEAWGVSPDATHCEHVSVNVALGTLCSLLRAELPSRSDGGLRLSGDSRRAIRALCAAAHEEHLRAEQLLVVVKQALNSLPEVATLPYGAGRADALARVISLCIEEFYAGQS